MERHTKRIWNLDLIEEILIHSKNIIINISKANLFSHLHSNQHLRKKRKQIGEDAGNCFVGRGTGRGKGKEGSYWSCFAGRCSRQYSFDGVFSSTGAAATVSIKPCDSHLLICCICLFVRLSDYYYFIIWMIVCLSLCCCLQSRHNFQENLTCFTNNPITCLTLIHTLVTQGHSFLTFLCKTNFYWKKLREHGSSVPRNCQKLLFVGG